MDLIYRCVSALTCAMLAITASVAYAADAARVLTLPEALDRSATRHPELAILEQDLAAQTGRVLQAGSRPQPELGLLVENALGSGTRGSFDAAESTLSIGYLIEHGARQRRLEMANAGSELLGVDAQIRRLELGAETARRYVELLANQARVAQARDASGVGEQALEAVRTRVRAAKVPPAEEARAQARLARLRLDEEHAHHEFATARQRLAAMWGSIEPDFDAVAGDLQVLPPLEPFAALRPRLERNPQLERFVSEKRLREAETRVAELRRKPPWQVTAGVRRFEDFGDHAFIVGISVPLASPALARGAIDESRANSRAVDARSAAARIQLDAELFALYQELGHAYSEVDVLRTEVVPRMEEAATQSRHAYERGRYGYVEWAAAQIELLDARHALSEAAADAHRLRIEIERLTGAALGGEQAPRELP